MKFFSRDRGQETGDRRQGTGEIHPSHWGQAGPALKKQIFNLIQQKCYLNTTKMLSEWSLLMINFVFEHTKLYSNTTKMLSEWSLLMFNFVFEHTQLYSNTTKMLSE